MAWNRYAPTAARRATGTRFRTHSAIDMHAHVVVPAAASVVDHAARAQPESLDPETIALNRQQSDDRRSRMTIVSERLADLDAMGLARQAIMPSPGQCYYAVPAATGLAAARAVNDGVAEYAQRGDGRLLPFGTVPLQDPRAAVDELRRCRQDLGFHGVQILTNVNGVELSDAGLEPLFAEAARLRALIVLHPSGFTQAQRLGRYYSNNVIGNPLDMTVALHHLVLGGVLERHPDLRLFAVHGGGYAAAYAGRLDHAWGARSDARAGLPHPPSTYLKRIHYDTVVFDPLQLEHLVATFGADRLILGTDYPFDMADYDPLELLAAARLDNSVRHAIATTNARALIGE